MQIFIFALLIMFTPASIKAEVTSKNNRPYGGVLIWGTRNKPTIINPLLTTTSVSMSLLDLLFNRLVRLNAKGEIEPDLAESWDISADGMVYTFHLRKGVRFHDGLECTAADVKFTYDKIIDPQVHSPFQPAFQLVKDFKVMDKYTFQIILAEPSASFIYRLVREIVPKHFFEKADSRKSPSAITLNDFHSGMGKCFILSCTIRNSSFNFHPIGTGPFKFKEWTQDNQITLEYNPDYYEGRPYLDKIIVKAYPDSGSLWTGLMRGEVDYATFIEREDYEVTKDDPAFKTYAFAMDAYYAIFYNMADPLLADKRIREAIAYAIDRKALIEKAAYGYGRECAGPFYLESELFNPEVKPFEYNPKKASELLQQTGWRDTDNDGILEKEGEELELRVLVDTRSEIYQRIIMLIRQQLQEMGIKVKAVLYDNAEMLTREFLAQNKPQAQLKFSVAIIDASEHLAIEDWQSQESKRAMKLWVYQNEEVDRLFALGEITPDKEKRQETYQRMHQLIYADQPACFLYFPFLFHAVSAKLENVDDFFTINMPHYTMQDWYTKEKGGEGDGGD